MQRSQVQHSCRKRWQPVTNPSFRANNQSHRLAFRCPLPFTPLIEGFASNRLLRNRPRFIQGLFRIFHSAYRRLTLGLRHTPKLYYLADSNPDCSGARDRDQWTAVFCEPHHESWRGGCRRLAVRRACLQRCDGRFSAVVPAVDLTIGQHFEHPHLYRTTCCQVFLLEFHLSSQSGFWCLTRDSTTRTCGLCMQPRTDLADKISTCEYVTLRDKWR